MLAFSLRATLLVRALSYDANISRFSEIKIAVVYSGREDEETANGFLDGFVSLKSKKVKDIPLSASKVKLGNGISGYQVIYLSFKDSDLINKALKASNGIVSVTPYPKLVSSGVALGLGEKDGNPRIWVNLTASSDAGCKFSSDFLRLAEVVD